MTEVAGDGEQLRIAGQEAAVIALLRAHHASFIALQPMLVELLKSETASEHDIATVYEVCGNAWNMLEAIHDAA